MTMDVLTNRKGLLSTRVRFRVGRPRFDLNRDRVEGWVYAYG